MAGALSAQQPAAAPTPTVTVTGVAFVQYAYGLQVDSTLATPGHPNNFDVTRTFLHVLGHFSDGISTRVTLDVDGRKASTNQLSLRLAYAFVSWQPNARGPLTWKMGLMHTPWNEFEEAVWDYRMQGKSVLDRNGYGNTADFGAGVDGTWEHDAINLQAGVYNGEGAYSTPGDQGKDIAARVSVRLAESDLPGRVGGLRLSGFFQHGTATGGGARRRYLGMISWRGKGATFGALVAATQDSVNANNPEQKGQLLSVFGVLNIPHTKFAVLARYDAYDPNTQNSSTSIAQADDLNLDQQKRFVAGVSYAMSPHLRLLADVDLTTLPAGAFPAFQGPRQVLYLHTEFKF